jgi:hypothetical protein
VAGGKNPAAWRGKLRKFHHKSVKKKAIRSAPQLQNGVSKLNLLSAEIKSEMKQTAGKPAKQKQPDK